MKTLDEIAATEISEPFLKGMRNRMLMSFYKYGPVADAYPDKINALSAMVARVNQYRRTKNTEFLMDAANFLMIEFMYPSESDASFSGTDSDASPGRPTWRVGEPPTWATNHALTKTRGVAMGEGEDPCKK
jgi:hypothetical protein